MMLKFDVCKIILFLKLTLKAYACGNPSGMATN